MTVWVTGSGGMLGGVVTERLRELGSVEFTATSRNEVDIRDRTAVQRFAAGRRFSHIVNCAAYTQVDQAESEPEAARAVNRDGTLHLAEVARRDTAVLLHVSTDYVFGGATRSTGSTTPITPCMETDSCSPGNMYGETKLAGEQVIAEVVGGFTQPHFPALIVRTSWLFGSRGKHFVATMRRLLAERDEVRVVADQRGRPTYAVDLADALLRLGGLLRSPTAAPAGIYHFANAGETTWYGLTAALREQLLRRGERLRCQRLTPITSAEYPTAAKRPAYSVLSTDKFTRITGIHPRFFGDTLAEYLEST